MFRLGCLLSLGRHIREYGSVNGCLSSPLGIGISESMEVVMDALLHHQVGIPESMKVVMDAFLH